MNYQITDFIGIFDNVFTKEECDNLINYYETLDSLNYTVNHKAYSRGNTSFRKDETVFMCEPREIQLPSTQTQLTLFKQKFFPCYENYTDEFGQLLSHGKHGIISIRLQKTPPGGGFHDWHCENSNFQNCQRVVVFMLYLNDITEGGETEFLYYRKRVQPVTGRLLIWPSGYTHTHRGNPPLNETKYILTGWLELMD
jgi:hypothetical protein